MASFIGTYAEPNADIQTPFDAAVVMPTVLRPEIQDALRSVFAQDLQGRIHILIGIDAPVGCLSFLDRACVERPPNCVVQVFYPGYSSSVRHGGLSASRDGGVLRCVLSYLANSPYVAYLDDDNWWRRDHLRLMRQALTKADWAFSLRWFIHPETRRTICIDQWESTGAGCGVYHERFGGFVDPNCLMLNKIACEQALPQWNRPLPGDEVGMSADRNVFEALHKHSNGIGTDQPTVFYKLNPADGMHGFRLQMMGPAYDEAGTTPPS